METIDKREVGFAVVAGLFVGLVALLVVLAAMGRL